jgi:hypothetical protein
MWCERGPPVAKKLFTKHPSSLLAGTIKGDASGDLYVCSSLSGYTIFIFIFQPNQ